jgi:bisphosphoglycerate-dependent phosphoglycerate mutase
MGRRREKESREEESREERRRRENLKMQIAYASEIARGFRFIVVVCMLVTGRQEKKEGKERGKRKREKKEGKERGKKKREKKEEGNRGRK